MKKVIFASAVAIVAFMGCKSAASGDPKTVLKAFFEAVRKNDMETAQKLATSESQMYLSMASKFMTADNNKKMAEQFDTANVHFGDPKIDGDNATVPISYGAPGDGVANFPLKKEGGEWKVDINLNSMMNMGLDKSNKQLSPEDMKKVNQGMEQLKGMNVDSLENEMIRKSGSMKKINVDSLMKVTKQMTDSLKF